MKHLIDKDALVAEIDRRIKEYQSTGDDYWFPVIENLKSILSFLDTLEVKEVNLEYEVESYWKQCDMTWCRDAYSMTHIRSMLSDIAKHFFELGLKTQKGENI